MMGKRVNYDRDTIKRYLNINLEMLEEEKAEFFTMLRNVIADQIQGLLCVHWKTFELGISGKPLRLNKGSLTTMTQIWVTFLCST